jgi:hypothetical protein
MQAYKTTHMVPKKIKPRVQMGDISTSKHVAKEKEKTNNNTRLTGWPNKIWYRCFIWTLVSTSKEADGEPNTLVWFLWRATLSPSSPHHISILSSSRSLALQQYSAPAYNIHYVDRKSASATICTTFLSTFRSLGLVDVALTGHVD